jgi:hypothetical protein
LAFGVADPPVSARLAGSVWVSPAAGQSACWLA